MTTPSSPLYDGYLAGSLGKRRLDQLSVVTTVNPTLQRAAQQIVTDQVRTLGSLHITDGSLVSIDLRPACYGCILSMVGTANVDKTSRLLNMAVVPREPGTSFMPFTYLAGFERKLSPGTTVKDDPLSVPDPSSPNGYYTPENYDLRYHGRQSLRRSLGNAYNIPAVKVEIYTTRRAVAKTAVKLGISDLRRDNPRCCSYALTLGGLERGVPLLQETAAYGAFATNGIRVMPISFKEIRDRITGQVLWRASSDSFLAGKRRRVAPAVDAYMVNSALSDNSARKHEFGLDSPLRLRRPAAAKSGTTNSFTDNWTEGYTPQLVAGVWVGNADASPMVGSTGITGAAPIWHDFMQTAFQVLKLPAVRFARPSGLTIGRRCRLANRAGQKYGRFSYGYGMHPVGTTPFCTVPTVPDAPAH
jgi:membrane peptidoglycan carboxypeptidase